MHNIGEISDQQAYGNASCIVAKPVASHSSRVAASCSPVTLKVQSSPLPAARTHEQIDARLLDHALEPVQ
jgi:hypothetical protein